MSQFITVLAVVREVFAAACPAEADMRVTFRHAENQGVVSFSNFQLSQRDPILTNSTIVNLNSGGGVIGLATYSPALAV